MIVKLLTEHYLECLSLKRGCRGSYESTLVKMSNCWKSHAVAQLLYIITSHVQIRDHQKQISALEALLPSIYV